MTADQAFNAWSTGDLTDEQYTNMVFDAPASGVTNNGTPASSGFWNNLAGLVGLGNAGVSAYARLNPPSTNVNNLTPAQIAALTAAQRQALGLPPAVLTSNYTGLIIAGVVVVVLLIVGFVFVRGK